VSAAAAADKCPQTTVGKLFYRLVVFDYLLEIAMAALVPFLKVSIRRCIARCSQDDAVAKALQKAKDTDAQDLDPEQRELLRVCLTFFFSRNPYPRTMHAGLIWVMTINGSVNRLPRHAYLCIARMLSHATRDAHAMHAPRTRPTNVHERSRPSPVSTNV
jgi:hypothetical protein